MADKITTSRFSLEELPDALEQILTEYQSAMFDTRQEALQAGAEVFKSAVESVDLCQYFGQKKLKYYADFFSSSSSLCCGVI